MCHENDDVDLLGGALCACKVNRRGGRHSFIGDDSRSVERDLDCLHAVHATFPKSGEIPGNGELTSAARRCLSYDIGSDRVAE